MKNVKTNNVNLYYSFPPRFLKSYFSTEGACALSGPRRVAYDYNSSAIYSWYILIQEQLSLLKE